MKRLALFILPAFILGTFMLFSVNSRVLASPVSLTCWYGSVNQGFNSATNGCDLAINKQVSVNGGAYHDANSASQAQQVNVGDTVTWKITVTDNSLTSPSQYYPTGLVTVTDNLPSGISFVSATTSTGTYSNGSWGINLLNYNDLYNPPFSEPLPATLTITTKVITLPNPTTENTAKLSYYDTNDCGDDGLPGLCNVVDPPSYIDANSANNSSSAYINGGEVLGAATVAPTATTTPSAPSTGFGVSQYNPWLSLGIFSGVATVLAGLAYLVRKNAIKNSVGKS